MFIIMQAGVIISFKSVFYITPLNLIILLINLQPFLGEKEMFFMCLQRRGS